MDMFIYLFEKTILLAFKYHFVLFANRGRFFMVSGKSDRFDVWLGILLWLCWYCDVARESCDVTGEGVAMWMTASTYQANWHF